MGHYWLLRKTLICVCTYREVLTDGTSTKQIGDN